MSISRKILEYFNRKQTKSTEKNRVRYRNDICNHWDLDYLSMEEIEKKLETDDPITTIPKKKKDSG